MKSVLTTMFYKCIEGRWW